MSAPELRIDQLTGLRTLIAPGRAERPDAFVARAPEVDPAARESCPFCEGREARTPPEVWANRPGGGEADSPGWTQRAVPNLYPALTEPEAQAGLGEGPGPPESGFGSAADPLRGSARTNDMDLFSATPAHGSHEVIVNSPRHVTALAELSEEELAGALSAWRARIGAHAGEASLVHLIVNEGPAAGASLEHSHAQLYALPFVPAEVARSVSGTTHITSARWAGTCSRTSSSRRSAAATGSSRSTAKRRCSVPGHRARRSRCA